MIVPVIAISNLVLTQQICSEETNGAHAHNRDRVPLSNLIGSLSRTIQQYSPPSEWIMCELGVFPIFVENDLLKVDKILRLTFFKARKDLEGFNTAFFNLL